MRGEEPSYRKRQGVAGAMLAGAMIAVRDILEMPKDDEAVIIEASSEPEDIDDGMNFVVDANTIAYTPPMPRHRAPRDSHCRGLSGQTSTEPPATSRTTPVIQSASSEARNSAA